MSQQFADFLATHGTEIADRAAELRRQPGDATADEPARRYRQLVNAVVVALSAADLRPLITMYRLQETTRVTERLEAASHDIQALAVAAVERAQASGQPPEAVATLSGSALDEAGRLQGQLGLDVARRLEQRLLSATSESSAQSTSISVTMHELRRPLTILNSYGQLLATGMLGELPESALVAIEGITASTEMMVRMVNSLAELSRLEDPDDRMSLEQLTADDVVAGAVEPVALEARLRGTTVQADVQPDVSLRGDRRRLVLALTNLIGNAVKHGPPDSVVEVTVRADESGVHFLVRDHGAGFPPEDAQRLFDKYYRSVAERHRKVPGSGLGLYIVRTVAQRHGGTVSARSVPDNGAEFEMIIPVHGDFA